ncbi:hypothetical protein BY996DRAFT_6482696 [Phakopsora pachyrhizi]|nr:hypothetical protein BY996DRAFT_6482696 [Phakopsora pachyrhizi]
MTRSNYLYESKKDSNSTLTCLSFKHPEIIRLTQIYHHVMPLFGYAIANYLRRSLYYFSLDSMHTYLPTNSSYSGYPPFCVIL